MTFIKITSRNKHDWLVNPDHIVAIVEHPFNDIYILRYICPTVIVLVHTLP